MRRPDRPASLPSTAQSDPAVDAGAPANAVPARASRFAFRIEPTDIGRRIDAYLAAKLTHLSRNRIQGLIAGGHVTIADRERVRAADRLRLDDRVTVDIPAPSAPPGLRPETIPLSVVYEDDNLIVIDKAAGMTVHPGAGRETGTLVHAILARCPDLPGIGGEHRPGIVHRLDK